MDANHSKALAHISADGLRTQTVADHLRGTAALCRDFADVFGASEYGYAAGLLHDIGKYSTAFQRRLQGGEKVDHSTAGAQEALKLGQPEIAFAVAGHHSGLPDGGSPNDTADESTLFGRKKRPVKPYQQWRQEIQLSPIAPYHPVNTYSQIFFTRMLYSCLVDADYLDTETFMSGAPLPRGQYDRIPTLLEKLHAYIAPWQKPSNELNAHRSQILNACLQAGRTSARGLFTLTVPTGGGKTLSSLAFALELAAKQKMDRVIYVIPYTSIIDQNAAVFANILGEENVLEHHSGVDYSAEEDADALSYRKALAAENWDAPVIVTTAVQFFESLYGSRAAKCRKLHNIANSVIIFDEAQTIPVPYLRPCVAAIAELVSQYRAAAVLCTATQPALGPLFAEFAPRLPMQELCPTEEQQYAGFRRTTLRESGTIAPDELARALSDLPQVLCIVNRRKTAQDLYASLPAEGSYCLTTLLYPAHRKQILQEIRSRLAAGLPCRVVSTSLIEAGVDVDFPAVYREMAGLDSILQAAGRCNREGRRLREDSTVTIFRLKDCPIPAMQRLSVSAAEHVLRTHKDAASLDAIEAYFTFFRNLKGDESLDAQHILSGLVHGMENRLFPFATAAERFHLIDSPTQPVYIPLGDGADLVEALRNGAYSKKLFRKLGQYAVPVYPDLLKQLELAGAVERVEDSFWVLTSPRFYDAHIGLALPADCMDVWFI